MFDFGKSEQGEKFISRCFFAKLSVRGLKRLLINFSLALFAGNFPLMLQIIHRFTFEAVVNGTVSVDSFFFLRYIRKEFLLLKVIMRLFLEKLFLQN